MGKELKELKELMINYHHANFEITMNAVEKMLTEPRKYDCPRCDGEGFIRFRDLTKDPNKESKLECGLCNGDRFIELKPYKGEE